MVKVYNKEQKAYEEITLQYFDKKLHEGFISYTNHYGWFLNTRSIYNGFSN